MNVEFYIVRLLKTFSQIQKYLFQFILMMTMATEDRAVVADEEVVWGTSLYKITSNCVQNKSL